MKKQIYDIIVIGAGHAGVEAALACARLKKKTLMLTVDVNNIAFLACNPSIGGTAKGQIASEVDALGGEMGKAADASTIHRRVLNQSKGPAVWSLRAQVDIDKYHAYIREVVYNQKNLTVMQGEVIEILTVGASHLGSPNTEGSRGCPTPTIATGIKLRTGETFSATAVVVAAGVYLDSKIFCGDDIREAGPATFAGAYGLSKNLEALGHKLSRFKTGTPPRVDKNTINYKELEVQHGDPKSQNFSMLTNVGASHLGSPNAKGSCGCPTPTHHNTTKVDCHITYTNQTTHEIIRKNLELAPSMSGEIIGTGARYCPSIESKVVRFSDRQRHQLFLEPETEHGNEIYIGGFSTSFGRDIQKQMVASIKGLEKAKILRDGYAIEYAVINSIDLFSNYESKHVKNLFFAGQVNGTSGYEEAAAQGFMAGVNAARSVDGKEPIVLKRNEAYIGVLTDDLMNKGTLEPYRMMTSRAEYRLVLRQDNAAERLYEVAKEIGLWNKARKDAYKKKKEAIKLARELFKKTKIDINTINVGDVIDNVPKKGSLQVTTPTRVVSARSTIDLSTKGGRKRISLVELAKNPKSSVELFFDLPELKDIDPEVIKYVFSEIKYEGYIKRAENDIEKMLKEEATSLPTKLDYTKIKGLKTEAQNRLNEVKPTTLAQASRVSGVTPADIMVLSIYLKLQK